MNGSDEATFHLVAYRVDRRGQAIGAGDRLTRYPMTHRECEVMRSKFTRRADVEIRFKEARGSQAVDGCPTDVYACSMSEKTCSHCERPIGAGGSGGLDARCYQYQRRNGTLPPKDLLQTGDLEEQVTVRVPAKLLKAAEAAAKASGVDFSSWVRSAMTTAAERKKRR